MNNTILALKASAVLCRIIAHALRFWFVALLIWLFTSLETPHLYIGDRTDHYFRCTYFGSTGFVVTHHFPDCPLLVLFNPTKGERL